MGERGFRFRAAHAFALTLTLCGVLGGYIVIETAAAPPDDSALTILARGQDWPLLSHLAVALPALLAFAVLLLRRRTVALPGPKIGVPLAVLGGLAWASALGSSYRGAALPAAVEWSAYGLVFFGLVAAGGRNGGRLLLGAIALGGAITALLAVRQYGDMKGADPNFRVFGPWNNPNATGAYLAIALVCALALIPGAERLGRLAAALGAVVVALGLALTQSKGAWLACGVGLAVWLLTLVLSRSRRSLVAGGGALAVLAVAAALAFAATRPPAPGPTGASAGAAFGRISNSEASSAQSVGFRRLLWRSAWDLARTEPLEGGLNSFGPRSARPGHVTQTQLAHSTPLQLACEITPLGGGLFLLVFLVVAATAVRGARALGEERKPILAGAGGALACAIVHNFTDSDAYTFGLGLTLLALAAILLLAASDTSAPELVPLPWRLTGAGTIAALLLLWGYFGWIDASLASARGIAFGGHPAEGREIARAATEAAPFDARGWSLRALVTPEADERLGAARRATETGPTARNERALGRELAAQGNTAGAERAYRAALRLDPHNLPALAALRELLATTGNATEAREIALRTVAVERTTYYTTRSQPELVPTQTAEARAYLAASSPNGERVPLLGPALATYRAYARTTVPVVVRFDDGSGKADYGGETRAHAEGVVAQGRKVAADLRALGYERRELDGAAADFDRAAALLRSDSSAR